MKKLNTYIIKKSKKKKLKNVIVNGENIIQKAFFDIDKEVLNPLFTQGK